MRISSPELNTFRWESQFSRRVGSGWWENDVASIVVSNRNEIKLFVGDYELLFPGELSSLDFFHFAKFSNSPHIQFTTFRIHHIWLISQKSSNLQQNFDKLLLKVWLEKHTRSNFKIVIKIAIPRTPRKMYTSLPSLKQAEVITDDWLNDSFQHLITLSPVWEIHSGLHSPTDKTTFFSSGEFLEKGRRMHILN